MPRTYRVVLEVDIYVEGPAFENDTWEEIELDLEKRDDWDVYMHGFGSANTRYVNLESYV